MAARTLPSGWPRQVPPPVGDQWVTSAVAWLLDQCPAEYRSYPVLRRQPVVLAAFAAWQVQAQSDAARHGLAVARNDLRGVGVSTVEEALLTLERELARLQLLTREVAAVQHALNARPGLVF